MLPEVIKGQSTCSWNADVKEREFISIISVDGWRLQSIGLGLQPAQNLLLKLKYNL